MLEINELLLCTRNKSGKSRFNSRFKTKALSAIRCYYIGSTTVSAIKVADRFVVSIIAKSVCNKVWKLAIFSVSSFTSALIAITCINIVSTTISAIIVADINVVVVITISVSFPRIDTRAWGGTYFFLYFEPFFMRSQDSAHNGGKHKSL